jgi:hypothetical protein
LLAWLSRLPLLPAALLGILAVLGYRYRDRLLAALSPDDGRKATGEPPVPQNEVVAAWLAFRALLAGDDRTVETMIDDGEAGRTTEGGGRDAAPATDGGNAEPIIENRDVETMTAVECARAAVDAGLDPDAVEALRQTFEEVRYGGAPPTDERVQRARGALRAIDDWTGATGQ